MLTHAQIGGLAAGLAGLVLLLLACLWLLPAHRRYATQRTLPFLTHNHSVSPPNRPSTPMPFLTPSNPRPLRPSTSTNPDDVSMDGVDLHPRTPRLPYADEQSLARASSAGATMRSHGAGTEDGDAEGGRRWDVSEVSLAGKRKDDNE